MTLFRNFDFASGPQFFQPAIYFQEMSVPKVVTTSSIKGLNSVDCPQKQVGLERRITTLEKPHIGNTAPPGCHKAKHEGLLIIIIMNNKAIFLHWKKRFVDGVFSEKNRDIHFASIELH